MNLSFHNLTDINLQNYISKDLLKKLQPLDISFNYISEIENLPSLKVFKNDISVIKSLPKKLKKLDIGIWITKSLFLH